MSITRVTFKKKIYGKDAEGNDTDDYIELKRTQELIVTHGTGIDFIREHWHFVWPDDEEDNEYNRDRTKITIPCPSGATIEFYVINRLLVSFGTGITFQRWRMYWDNTENNTARKSHVKTITGSDDTSTIDVEIIDEWRTVQGAALDYQKKFWEPLWPQNDAEDDSSAP